MYLGLNLSHGSSACLIDETGALFSAIEEERLSRVKNHYGIPNLAIQTLIENAPSDFEITKVVHGSFQTLDEDSLVRILSNNEDSPSNPRGSWKLPRPGWSRPVGDGRKIIESRIQTILLNHGISQPESIWVKHHDAHLGTAHAAALASGKPESLLVTLDGEGDGESGTVAIARSDGRFLRVSSTSKLDSLGYLYQAVTERYNFKGNQHEGKITGLAAFGKMSFAAEILSRYIEIEDGKLTINFAKSRNQNRTIRSLRRIGLAKNQALSLEEIVDLASSKTNNYEDLAFAVQKVLEDSVVEMISYWLEKTGLVNLSVSGGVFANVKLNQKISEIKRLEFFDIFPNMGDAGLSAGGVWSYQSSRGSLTAKKPYDNMFLAPVLGNPEDLKSDKRLNVKALPIGEIAKSTARLIASGSFVGLHYGAMEFGPRALGHRSLLLDPRDGQILRKANERLRRTEFMPFAPVVLRELFEVYFDGEPDQRPGFQYMTITCGVKREAAHLIPAVTHIDETARPQVIVSDPTDIYSQVLSEFYSLTGVAVLVNTSLNVHETPINYTLQNSVDCLLSGAIDCIATDGYLITLKSD
jgi:carbamoyltransferase